MKEREIANNNKILEILIGSHLYGTSLETSDKDYSGIFMPDVEYVLGFQHCEEVDLSIKSKTDEGKNTEKAIDRKFYEFRKFVKLALDNNPNILEMLFVNRDNIIFANEIGNKLLKIRHLFPHKGLKQKFLGYAFSQKHKMVIKKDNYLELVDAFNYLKRYDIHKFLFEVALQESIPPFINIIKNEKDTLKFIKIGDLNIIPSRTIKKTLQMIEERINKAGHRTDYILKYGYDTKFASHLIRLMLEGVELLKTGEVKFPLLERNMILDIKKGKWTVEEVLTFSDELERDIERLTIKSTLPNRPNVKEIQNFTIETLKEYIYG